MGSLRVSFLPSLFLTPEGKAGVEEKTARNEKRRELWGERERTRLGERRGRGGGRGEGAVVWREAESGEEKEKGEGGEE